MKKILQKQREWLAVLAYVGIIAALVWGVIFPLLGKINEKRDQIQEQGIKEEAAKKRLGELPKIKQQDAEITENRESLDMFFDQGNAVTLIETLEKLAQDTGNKITITVRDKNDQQPQKPATSKAKADPANALVDSLPSGDYLQMNIALVGDYAAAARFIKALESFKYYCDITAMQIGVNEDKNTVSNSSGSGSFDPFASKGTEKNQANEGPIASSLDVVFYVKK